MDNRESNIEDEIERLVLSDELSEASTLILDSYGPRAKRILYNSKVKDTHQIETILHDSTLLLISRLKERKEMSNFKSFFYSTCVNKGKDFRKSFVKRNFISASIDYFVDYFDSQFNRSMTGSYLPKEVKKSLKKLSEECQSRIKSYFYEDRTHREIASIYSNTSNARVSSVQLSRCIERLRQLIENEGV